MFNNYNRRKKHDTVFLNVKPTFKGQDGGLRKYSTGLLDTEDNPFHGGNNSSSRGSRVSVGTITTLNEHFRPNIFYSNIAPIQWFLHIISVLPITRREAGKAKFRLNSVAFGYSLGFFALLANIFYSNIAPIQWFLHIISVLPITRREAGKAKFRLNSVAFGYSLGFFALLAVYVFYVAKNRIKIVSSLSGPFEEAVIAYLFIVNILPLLMIPILWWEARKIAKLWNDWDDFEILYYQISGHSLPLNLFRKTTTIAIALPLLSILSVVITHITMADFQLMQVIPYCILDNLTAMLGAWWFMVCESLSMTANILGERFQRALRHIGPAAMVADYRALWLRLSKLTRDTGNAVCYTFTFLNLYLFFVITLSVYGLMSQLSEGFGIKDIGLAITAIWNVFLLFYICDKAHYASFNVRTNFQKKLLMVELNWMNSDAQTEINMFIRATEMNPSNINCGGFFDVNRNLFKGLLTTMVTYLVVLLQFQISIPTDAGKQMNVSMADLITEMIIETTELTSTSTTPKTTTTTTTKMPPPARGRKG